MTSMHENSLRAYEEELPKFPTRRQAIYDYIIRLGPVTDRQIKDGMGHPDMNMVRPRVTELIKMGLIQETGSVRDTVTGKTVRRVANSYGQLDMRL